MAKAVIEDLTKRAQEVVDVHENNRVFSYSDQIAAQVSDSYAGNSFVVVRNSLTAYEMLKTAALWEKAGIGTISIPTAIALIESGHVTRIAARDAWESHANQATRFLNPNSDPKIQSWHEEVAYNHQLEFARQQKRLCISSLKLVAKVSKHAAFQCEEINSLLNSRHYIAHYLENTSDERKGRMFVKPRWQGVWNIQQLSIWIIETLYCWVNGVSFSLQEDCRQIARDNAQDFWGNATFNPER